MNDDEGINRRAGSDRKTVCGCHFCELPFEEVPRIASRKLPRSATVFRPLPSHLLTPSPSSMRFFIRRRLCEIDKVWDLTHSVFSTKKCRNFQSIVSLRSHFTIHNNNKPFSSMSQSQSIVWVKQKQYNICQTTNIVTRTFIKFFFVHPARRGEKLTTENN